MELSPVTWLLLIPPIAFDNNLVTPTMNEVLTSATSMPDMRTSAFFLRRVEARTCVL